MTAVRHSPFVEVHEQIICRLSPEDQEKYGQIIREAAYALAYEPQTSMRESVEQLHDDLLDGTVTTPIDMARRLEAAVKKETTRPAQARRS